MGNKQDVITGLANFTLVDDEVDPECLKGNIWELIREDLILALRQLD